MENNKGQDDDISDKIKIFSSEDEKLKILGELLSNKSSRDIIKLLTDEEMYTNEIANRLGIKANLIIHHLKKLQELGLLEIKNKRIIEKGKEHRFFRMVPGIFVLSNSTKEEIREKRTLKKIFRNGIKFASIVIMGLASFMITSKIILSETSWSSLYYVQSTEFLSSVIIALCVIIAGLIVERVYTQFKK